MNEEIEEIGLETCSACNGKKYVRINYQGSRNSMVVKIGGFNLNMPICPKCNGKGKVSWLVNVFEKEDEEIHWYSGMISGSSGTSGCTDHHEKRECYKTKSSKNWNGRKVRR